MSAAVRISVVVPTFQRRALAEALVAALGRQEYARPFEAIVVVDGSTDGTAEALAALDPTPRFPLRVISQPNAGAARARNRGAAAASGEILLFLDDDMEPDPRLLAEHDRSHQDGAEVVVGAIPLHPDSPATLLAEGVGAWADAVARKRAEPHYAPRIGDVVSGQMSVRRALFMELGGFDERFTADGSYGNEDLDFGHRLASRGHRVVHNPAAVSRQRYVVDAETHLRQYFQVGQADVAIVRKHPELAREVFEGQLLESRLHALLRRPVSAAPRLAGVLAAAVRRPVVRRVDRGDRGALLGRLFFALRAVEYWRGVQRAGGEPRPDAALRVLCYHAIADLSGDAVMEQYGVPPDAFREQLATLRRSGYRFVTGDEVVRFLDGAAGLPRRAVLITFDDGYADLAERAHPLLEAHGIPAVVFAVSGRLGATSDWDVAGGARPLRLLTAAELSALARLGIEVGCHSHSHRELTALPDAELRTEITVSLEHLQRAGLGSARLFAYPYGEHDARVRQAVAAAGLRAAFTTDPGLVRESADRFALPRIEIFKADVGWRFRAKVALGGPRAHPRTLWSRARGWARLRTRLRSALRARGAAG